MAARPGAAGGRRSCRRRRRRAGPADHGARPVRGRGDDRRRRRRPGPHRGRDRRPGRRPVHRPGPSAAAARGRASAERGALRRFAAVMESVHAVQPGWAGWPDEDTVICRCEEVTLGELRAAIGLGADDARSAKLLARPGMGWCQGRMCGQVVDALVAAGLHPQPEGGPADLTSDGQPPARARRAGRPAAPDPGTPDPAVAGAADPASPGGGGPAGPGLSRPLAQPVPLRVLAALAGPMSQQQRARRGRRRARRVRVVRPEQQGNMSHVTGGEVCQPSQPWHGVLVANALPYNADLSVDFDRYAEHVAWLAASGCDGITPNGSLGEYQVLTPEERTRVVETAVAAAPAGFSVIPGVAAYGARESARLGRAGGQGRRGRGHAAAAELLPGRRAQRARPLPRGRGGRPAHRRLQQPGRHQGRPDAGAAGPAVRRGPDRRRQGVHRRPPAGLRDRRAGAGARRADRLR